MGGIIIKRLLIVGLLKVTGRHISGKLSNTSCLQRSNKWHLEMVSSTSPEACEQRLVFSFGTMVGPCDSHSLWIILIKFPYIKFLFFTGNTFLFGIQSSFFTRPP